MRNRENEWFDWLKTLLIALILAITIRLFVFSPIIVDGPSMQPTLFDGDQMIINKLVYNLKDPDRFDVVVFHASEQKDFIKRVIGLPGEHVKVENNVLYIDGKAVDEPFINNSEYELSKYYTEDFQLENLPGNYETIPEGYVLVLGDNRNNSTDSRMLGLVAIDEIVGKASVIYWPLNRIHIVKE